MSEKKTFTSEKIRTSEICGIDGNLTIQSPELLKTIGISGENVSISGSNMIITDGGGEGFIDLKSGDFENLVVDGVKYTPRDQLVYAFRFGGPLTEVPSRLSTILGSNPPLFTGIEAGDNKVFVDDSGIFSVGDQIIINPHGYYGNLGSQEEHVVTNISYYQPNSCCNVTTASSQSAGNSFVLHRKEEDIFAGDVIKFSGHSTLYKVNQTGDNGTTVRLDLDKILTDNVSQDHCVCLIRPMLETQDNLYNDYPEGTKVARKYSRTSTVLNEGGNGDIYWGNTVLLINSDGHIHDSDIFVDSSLSNHTLTTYGDTHHDTGIYKFGDSSISLDEDEDYLTIPDHSDFDFGTAPFTIETWFYVSNLPSTYSALIMAKGDAGASVPQEASFQMGIAGPADQGGGAVQGTHAAGKMIIARLFDDNYSYLYSNTVLSERTWYHVAIVREGTGTNQMRLYINGELDSSWTKTNSTHANLHPLLIGAMKWNGTIPAASTEGLDGYMEDIRITKGVARYTASFSVPTENFEEFTRGPNSCDSTCYDTQHLYLDVGTYSGLGPSWINGMGENEPQWDWFLSGYREHFIDFSGVGVNITGNNTFGVLSLVYPDKGI
jgi:hypothetical protein